MNPYDIDINQLMDQAQYGNQFSYPVTRSVPAGETVQETLTITSDSHFLITQITGDFTTQSGGSDDGIPRLSMKWFDTGRSRQLFQDFIPVQLFLSPGRSKSLAGGGAGNQLFYPFDWFYPVVANSDLVFEFQSTATTDSNTVNLMLHGFKYAAK